MRWFLRALLAVFGLLVVAGVAAGFWLRGELRASLPQLDGQIAMAGLTAPVEVHRDALGIPTIRGANRRDVARATGFVHAQDRFFQMDLSRRRAAGELAALVGPAAVNADRAIRLHRFRAEAEGAVALLDADDREVLDAYTEGVNAGLDALGGFPFEYLVLRQAPEPWRPEDSLLVVLSMFATLQDDDGSYEATLATMDDVLPPAVVDFLAPQGTEWDAPITGLAFEQPAIPGPEIYAPRARSTRQPPPAARARRASPWRDPDTGTPGSNNWAVSGALTADGAVLVANDMHLGIRVPNTWYRAELQWPDPEDPLVPNRLMGVTLPGLPSLVAGSNGFVAWGFTNAYTDSSDLVLLEIDRADPDRYRTPAGWQRFERYEETIEVAGAEPVLLPVSWTIWGPLLDTDHLGRPRAYRWVAHSAGQLAVNLRPLEGARTVNDALTQAHGIGTPGQNVIVGDRDGHIGWTFYGSIPRRVGTDGSRPASWADGAARWNGWLTEAEYPRIVDPDDGRLWTANARVIDDAAMELFGAGNYEVGSRASIIRDRLRDQDRFAPLEMLDLQLDTSARFLARWRDLILDTMTAEVVAGDAARAGFRDVVEGDWSGNASPDSAGYRLTDAFRDAVAARVFRFGLAEAYAADPRFNYFSVRLREGPLWALVTEQPAHWLEPGFESWDALLADTVDRVVAELMAERDGSLLDRAWSEVNTTRISHPLSGALPGLGRWLDMPETPLPGSAFTPRQQVRTLGASQRMVVSPGNEDVGIMHMPTGQSGHPLSPFYANSHGAWVRGEPTPFLPGPAQYRLTLLSTVRPAR